jgi:hypothetical protein
VSFKLNKTVGVDKVLCHRLVKRWGRPVVSNTSETIKFISALKHQFANTAGHPLSLVLDNTLASIRIEMIDMLKFCSAYNVPLNREFYSDFLDYSSTPLQNLPPRALEQRNIINGMTLNDIDRLGAELRVDIIENDRTSRFKLPTNLTLLRPYQLNDLQPYQLSDALGVMGLGDLN